MSDMFLSKEDVAILTGAKIKSKQIAQLRKMGLPFWVNADGVPVVPRSAIDGRPAKTPVEQPKPIPYVFRDKT
jgi:hypothetical protein